MKKVWYFSLSLSFGWLAWIYGGWCVVVHHHVVATFVVVVMVAIVVTIISIIPFFY